jgi:transposase
MAYKIEFTETVVAELEERLSTERDAKIYRRLLWLDLRRRGYNQEQIGDVIQVTPAQLTNWAKVFTAEGFKGLCHLRYEDRRPSKLAPYLEDIRRHVQEAAVSTLAALQAWIQDEYGLYVEQSWLSRWVKKNSVVLTRKRA